MERARHNPANFLPDIAMCENADGSVDLWYTLDNHLADGVAEEGDETTRVAVGFDRSVNVLLEVIYHELEDGTALVFHAMQCRKKWREELGMEE